MRKGLVEKVRFAPSSLHDTSPAVRGSHKARHFPWNCHGFPVGSPAKPSQRAGRVAHRAGWGGFKFMTSGENSFLFTAQVENFRVDYAIYA